MLCVVVAQKRFIMAEAIVHEEGYSCIERTTLFCNEVVVSS